MSAYLLGFGGVLVAAGRVAGTLGYRRTFVLGTAGFVVASALAGFAWTGGVLIAARRSRARQPRSWRRRCCRCWCRPSGTGRGAAALGMWTAIGAFGGTAGLLVGGVVTDGPGCGGYSSAARWWVSAVCLSVRSCWVSTARPAWSVPSAWPGWWLFAFAVALLGYGMTAGARAGWSGATIGSLALSAGLLVACALTEIRSTSRSFPARLRRSGPFLGGVLALFVRRHGG